MSLFWSTFCNISLTDLEIFVVTVLLINALIFLNMFFFSSFFSSSRPLLRNDSKGYSKMFSRFLFISLWSFEVKIVGEIFTVVVKPAESELCLNLYKGGIDSIYHHTCPTIFFKEFFINLAGILLGKVIFPSKFLDQEGFLFQKLDIPGHSCKVNILGNLSFIKLLLLKIPNSIQICNW